MMMYTDGSKNKCYMYYPLYLFQISSAAVWDNDYVKIFSINTAFQSNIFYTPFLPFQMATDLMNPVQCRKCDNPAAKFHCNTCGSALCPLCKAFHLKDRDTRHHDIVPYAKKLNPNYLMGLLCHTHKTDAPEYWCDTCGVPICGSCITEKHKGHQFSKLTAVLSEKRDAMLSEMKQVRDHTVKQWEEVLKEANKITADFLGSIDKTCYNLAARGKEMHKQVDNILAQSQRILGQIKDSGLAKLQEQERHLTNRLQTLNEEVKKYEDNLTGADTNALLQFKEKDPQSQEKMKPPSLETAPVHIFIQGQDDTKSMEAMFGHFSSEYLKQTSASGVSKPSTSTNQASPESTGGSKTLTPTSKSGSNSSATQRSLMPNPSVQSQFDVGDGSPHIACADQGFAWVRTDDEKLQLVDRKGSVKETINTDFPISGIALTSDGDLLLADYNYSCVRSVSRQTKIRTLFRDKTQWAISTLFRTSGKPRGLCCLHNGDMAVAFAEDRKVEVYSRDGQVRRTIDYKFIYPFKVAVNKVNQDICVCEFDSSYSTTGKLIAVGSDSQLRYEYSRQGEEKLNPHNVCTDQMGHVLITDYNNHCVHILDQEGRFIQYILAPQQGLCKPITIDVDREGYVWVGEFVYFIKGRVKVAKYLQ